MVSFWYWLILAILLFIVEILVPGAYFLWVGVTAAMMALLLYLLPDVQFVPQIVIWVLLSVVIVALYSKYLKKAPKTSDQLALNRRGEHYIDRMFTLTSPTVDGEGSIVVDDATWKTRGEELPAGSRVRVVSVDNQTLIVETVRD